MKAPGCFRFRKPGHKRFDVKSCSLGRLIADAQKNGRRGCYRFVSTNTARRGRDRAHRIAREAHDQETDNCIPESNHVPRQRDCEERNQDDVQSANPSRRKRHDGQPKQAGQSQGDANRKGEAPQGQLGIGDHCIVAGALQGELRV